MNAKTAQVAFLRPEVIAFATAMETQLKRNDHKGGWLGCDPWQLLIRLHEEVGELVAEMRKPMPDHQKILHEAADIANFAMMIADVLRGKDGQRS